MIKGVVDVYYNTTNPERAKVFYTEALGCQAVYSNEHWTALKIGGSQIGLHTANSIAHVPRDAHGAHGGAVLTLQSDNIAEDRARLERFGAKILGENEAHWGHLLVFEDLDGNVLKLMKPKTHQ